MKTNWRGGWGLRRLTKRVALWRARRRGPPYCATCGKLLLRGPDVTQQTHRGVRVYHRDCFPGLEALLDKAGYVRVGGQFVPKAEHPAA